MKEGSPSNLTFLCCRCEERGPCVRVLLCVRYVPAVCVCGLIECLSVCLCLCPCVSVPVCACVCGMSLIDMVHHQTKSADRSAFLLLTLTNAPVLSSDLRVPVCPCVCTMWVCADGVCKVAR